MNPYLVEQCRISRNYAKGFFTESVFSRENDFAFFPGPDSDKTVPEPFDHGVAAHVEGHYLQLFLIEIPSGALCDLGIVGGKKIRWPALERGGRIPR